MGWPDTNYVHQLWMALGRGFEFRSTGARALWSTVSSLTRGQLSRQTWTMHVCSYLVDDATRHGYGRTGSPMVYTRRSAAWTRSGTLRRLSLTELPLLDMYIPRGKMACGIWLSRALICLLSNYRIERFGLDSATKLRSRCFSFILYLYPDWSVLCFEIPCM